MNNIPACYTIRCKNNGWILYAGQFFCGECIQKLIEEKNKRLLKEINNATKKNTGN